MSDLVFPEPGVTVIYEVGESYINDLHKLYKREWWCKDRTLDDVKVVLENSSMVFGLIDKKSQALVGFTRVLTDHFRFAYIYDVIIHEAYRGKRLGKYLLSIVLEDSRIKHLKSIELVCRKDKISFYHQFGFSEDYGESIAMRKRK